MQILKGEAMKKTELLLPQAPSRLSVGEQDADTTERGLSIGKVQEGRDSDSHICLPEGRTWEEIRQGSGES